MNNINKNHPEVNFIVNANFHPSLNGWFYVKRYNGFGEANIHLKDGKLHNDINFPALIFKDSFGWYKNGNRHRLDGPCIIHGFSTSKPYKVFAIEDVDFTEQAYWNHPLVIKNKLDKILKLM